MRKLTDEFFRRHWCTEDTQAAQFECRWSDAYQFTGNIPNHDRQGCYALEENGEVIYVGSGIGQGAGIYEGHGIGSRLMSHVVEWDRSQPATLTERLYKPREKWRGITAIYTLGFPKEYSYLAVALEAFLIGTLRPRENVQHQAFKDDMP